MFLFPRFINQYSLPSLPVLCVFLGSLFYWSYLAIICQTIVVHDSVAFESMAQILYQDGWIEFFKTGPHREPFYLILISFSMRLGDVFSLHYFEILKIFQVLFLCATQFLMYKLLKDLKIREGLISIGLVYLALSPSIVNTAFNLYSEIVVYPFVLGIVLLNAKIWKEAENYFVGKALAYGLALGLLYLFALSVKALFSYIFILLLLPHLFRFFAAAFINKRFQFSLLVMILAAVVSTLTFLHTYKSLNKKYNGYYALTYRGGLMLYGLTAIRTSPWSIEKLKGALKINPPNSMTGGLENIAFHKRVELSKEGVSEKEIDRYYVALSKKMILDHPFQFTFFYLLQAVKMAFWETANIGFVVYPRWLTKVYESSFLEPVLNYVSGILTLIGLFFCCRCVWFKRRQLFSDQEASTLFFMLCMIVSYISLYSLFMVLPRYILALAPVYLTSILFAVQYLTARKS